MGNDGLIKVVLKFSFGYPKWHFWTHKDGHFWQKCPYSGSKKFHFGYPTANFKTTFIVPTSPKNDGIALGFRRLPLLGWFWANFWIWDFSPCILHYELKKIRTPFSRQVRDLTQMTKLSKIDPKTRIQGATPLGSNFDQNVSPYCTGCLKRNVDTCLCASTP